VNEKSSPGGLRSGGDVGASPNWPSWVSVLSRRSVTMSAGSKEPERASIISAKRDAPPMLLDSIFSRSMRAREDSRLMSAFGLIAIPIQVIGVLRVGRMPWYIIQHSAQEPHWKPVE